MEIEGTENQTKNILMSKDITKELNLKKLKEMVPIKSNTPEINNIYLSNIEIPSFQYENNFSTSELIEYSIKILINKKEKNNLINGYSINCNTNCKLEASVNEINTTTALFKRKHWGEIFKLLGDRLSIFILSNCTIIEKINNNFILLAGSFKNLLNSQKNIKNGLERSLLFKRMYRIKKLELNCTLNYLNLKFDLQNSLIKKINTIILRFNNLNITAIFKSKFGCGNFQNEFITKERSIDVQKIIDFLFLISKKIFKNNISFFNFRILKSKISLLIKKSKNETITFEEMKKYFKFNDKIFAGTNLNFKEKEKIFLNFIYFVFYNIYFPILTSYFYMTETSFNKLEVFYFLKSEFDYFSSLTINKFLKNYDEISGDKNSGFKIKVIPKEVGFRVITNMKKSKNLKYIEVYLKEKFKDQLENSILNQNDVNGKLQEYFLTHKNNFLLKFDLKNCYDRIIHSELKKILKDAIKEDDYFVIRGYTILENKGGIINSKNLKKCYKKRFTIKEILNTESFKESQLIAEDFIIYDITKEKIYEKIEENIFNTKINYKKRIYKSNKGIPQGSVLSPLLCSIYFAYLDKIYFNKYITDGIIIRYIDDFLIIGQHKEELCNLFNFINNLAEFGIKINVSKFQSNFSLKNNLEIFDYTPSLPVNNFITWAGLKIYDSNFSIKCAFSTLNLKTAFIQYNKNSVKHNCRRIILQCLKRFNPTYFNPSNEMKFQNLYDTFYVFYKKIFFLFMKVQFVNFKYLSNLENSLFLVVRSKMNKLGFKVSIGFLRKLAVNVKKNINFEVLYVKRKLIS